MPRSGCIRISTVGTAATASISETSTAPTYGRRRPSERSARTSAMPTTTASLASSDGWIDRPPSRSHDCDPLMVEPIVNTRTRPATEAR